MKKERKTHDMKHSTSSVRHGGGVMAWPCIDARGTGSLVFIDDVA